MDYRITTLGQLRPILKGFRKSAGMTQAMMANHLGVTQQTYAQLEANPAIVSVERLFKVLRVLDVSLALTQADVESRRDATATAATSAADTIKKAGSTVHTRNVATSTQGHAPSPKAVTKKRENW